MAATARNGGRRAAAATAEKLLEPKNTELAVIDGSKPPEPKKGSTKPNLDRDGCIAFGKRLAAARESLGYTQSSLGRTLRVSRSAVGQWELGNTYPAIDHVKLIADTLRVTPEYLLFGVSNDSPMQMSGSIPLIDKIDGKERVVTSVMLPKDFIARLGLTGQEKLRAVTVFNDGEVEGVRRGDIVIVNTEDKDIKGKGTFVVDNHERTAVAMVQTLPHDPNKMRINLSGDSWDVPIDRLPIVGRVLTRIPVQFN